jgi:hypothetical protein
MKCHHRGCNNDVDFGMYCAMHRPGSQDVLNNRPPEHNFLDEDDSVSMVHDDNPTSADET